MPSRLLCLLTLMVLPIESLSRDEHHQRQQRALRAETSALTNPCKLDLEKATADATARKNGGTPPVPWTEHAATAALRAALTALLATSHTCEAAGVTHLTRYHTADYPAACSVLDGGGAAGAGGRWNPWGMRVIYAITGEKSNECVRVPPLSRSPSSPAAPHTAPPPPTILYRAGSRSTRARQPARRTARPGWRPSRATMCS